MLKMEPVDMSATEIRRQLKAGENVTDLLPDATMRYIRENEVYQMMIEE